MQPSLAGSEQKVEKIDQSQRKQKQPQIFNFTKIVELFQDCKVFFTEDIQKQYGPLKSKQKNSEIQNNQNNQGFHKKDCQILDQIKKVCGFQSSQFHFNDEEKQIVFEEGLLMCVSMIEKFQNSHNYKKSRSIRRFLTKVLILLSKFLIEKVSKTMKEDFDLVFKISAEILLHNDSKTKDNQNNKPSKKEPWKLYHFQIPLIITSQKVPFNFYFIFNLLQQKFLSQQFSRKNKASQQLNDYVNLVCDKIMQTQGQQSLISVLVKTVCQIFGCIQFPVTYLFYSSLLSTMQRRFSEKYEILNSQSLQIFRIDREIFSSKNLILMFETLAKHQKNSFKQIQTQTVKTVFETGISQAQKFPCCLCSVVLQERITVSFIQNKPQKSKTKNHLQCKLKLHYCHDCYFNGSANKIEDFDQKVIEEKNISILTEIFLKSFWRQQFQLEQIRKFRDINYNLLIFEGKIPKVDDQSSNYIPETDIEKILNENQIAFICLRSLFSIQNNQPKKNKGTKIKQIISLKSSQQKLITLLLIMLNSKSQILRLQVIESLSKTSLVEYLSQSLTQSYILGSIKKEQQNQDSDDKNQSSQFLQNKIYQLFNQTKSRIYDKSEAIQIQSIKFLFALQKIYPQNDLKIEIFKFVTFYYQERLRQNNLKVIPSSVIKFFQEEIQQTCKKLDQNEKISLIITAKHMINIVLTLIFSFFNSKNQLNNEVGIEQIIRGMVLQVRRLIQKLLFLVNLQEKEMKSVSNNLQYQNLVISFLKSFSFDKATIRCFKVNDTILQKLIQLTQLGQGQQEPDYFSDSQKDMRLLSNLKLILQQLFQFNKQIGKSSVLSKSLQKKSTMKSKNSKFKSQIEDKNPNDDSTFNAFSSKDPTFNLNKVIKNILKREAKLTPLNCDILFLLIQKNILLNYESQTNFSETPSKVKRLILSLETIRRFQDILKFLQNEIKECNADFLSTYIELYVSICIQINEEKKVQMLFNYYLNVFKYFKKIWLAQYETVLEEYYNYSEEKTQPNKKNYNFFLRTLRTISIIATQFEKFKKIQNITEEYFSQIKGTKANDKKYSILTAQTQEAINSLQTEPEESFIKLYQETYDIMKFFVKHEILAEYIQLVTWSLDSLCLVLSIHPHLFVRLNQFFKQIPCRIQMQVSTINNYLKIFSSIIATGDSILMSLLSRSYQNIKETIWRQNQNKSFQVYQNFQTFCVITFSLLKEDIISFMDVTPQIFYCLFVKNKKINDLGKDYLEYLGKKGNDGILFNNFENTMINVSNKLQDSDKYFFMNKQYFINCQNLGKINKDRQWNQRLYLQKDLKQIKVRSTIVKKISEVLSNSLEMKSFYFQFSYEHLILALKILENQKEMDAYQLQEIVESMEKVIRENYLSIVRTYDGSQEQKKMQFGLEKSQEKQSQISQDSFDNQPQSWRMRIEKRKIMFVIGQMMYTLIKLTNQKKLKRYKKDLQKLIQAKRFNSVSINIKVNSFDEKQINSKKKLKKEQASSYILNYGECLYFFRYLDNIKNPSNDQEEYQKSLLDITKEFKNLAQKMYSIIFQDQKPRVLKNSQPANEIKNKKVKKSYPNNESDEEYSQYSQSQYTQISVSRQNSLSKIASNSSNKRTKRINTRSKYLTQSDKIATKKIVPKAKNISNSLPKKLEQRLSTINQELNHDQDFPKESRRSKRLMEKEMSKKDKRPSELR